MKLDAPPNVGHVIERLRALPTPPSTPEAEHGPSNQEHEEQGDEALHVLTEAIVMRNALLEVCSEIGQVMAGLEARLAALTPSGQLMDDGTPTTRTPNPQGGTTVKRLTPLAMMVVAIFLMVASAASAALPNQRTDLKVLLLSANGDEPSTAAWEAAMKREGVPFEKKIATQDEPYTASTFADTVNGAPRAKYQAVIVATGGLVYEDNGTYPSALSTEEWAALADFEVKYGIRQITGVVYPSAEYGLNTPTVSGELGGVVGKLTAAGLTTFPYLKGNVPIDQYTWGYQATPATGAKFKTLLTGPGNSALVGINTRADGREEMVSTFDSNQYQLQSALLRHGMLTWLTRGVYLGTERSYLTVQVDDIFQGSERWDMATNAETEVNPHRMTQYGRPQGGPVVAGERLPPRHGVQR